MLLAFQVRVSEGGAQPLGFPSGNLLTWTSSNLPPDTEITVQVRALNGFGEGDLSDPRTIRTRFGGML